ncbi:MAG TPA: SDR family NAD(P)-dependent oxidoreductase, partial [Acidimicrobiia bacterium]|nr:SDR family NAD(P)-dependent oxidoreductase [Acidimicrobiia bacterium]
MDLGVRGRGYLIVGGTGGMGLATAHVLAADGADLVLVGRNPDRAEAAAGAVRGEHGGRVIPVIADVSQPADAERMVDEALAALAPSPLGGVAVLTGLVGHQPIEAMTDDDWRAAVDDVLLGTVHSVRTALPHLVAAGGGTIVTTSAYSIRAPHAVR